MKKELIIKYLELVRDVLAWFAYGIWIIILFISIWNGLNIDIGKKGGAFHFHLHSKPAKQLFYESDTK